VLQVYRKGRKGEDGSGVSGADETWPSKLFWMRASV
jgi:hypothetical protein